MSNYLTKIGERIRDLRKSLDISQQELASRSGLKRLTINQIEQGKSNFGIDTLNQVCTALNCNLTIDLMNGGVAMPIIAEPAKIENPKQTENRKSKTNRKSKIQNKPKIENPKQTENRKSVVNQKPKIEQKPKFPKPGSAHPLKTIRRW